MFIKQYIKYLKQILPAPVLAVVRAVIYWKSRRKSQRIAAIVKKELAGKFGIEVGGPSALFRQVLPVYAVLTGLDGVNFSNATMWEGSLAEGDGLFEYDKGRMGKQYIAEATDLSAIHSGAYQFLLSSHCLEHVANPLKALREWIRVVESGGLLMLILPNKIMNFDHKRPVTHFKHLLDDQRKNMGEDDMTHLEEILKLHDLERDPWAGGRENFIQRCSDNFTKRGLHHHVFDESLIKEMTTYLGLELLLLETTQAEFIFLGRTAQAHS